MAIVVEDGTGLSTAVSYASAATADAYHLARGTTTWTGMTADKEAALVRATAALDALCASRWPSGSVRETEDQALAWPRIDAYDVDGYYLEDLPTPIVNACCEAALVELVSPGALSESLYRGGAVLREKVGPIETEYQPGASGTTVYRTIWQALARICPAGCLRIERV